MACSNRSSRNGGGRRHIEPTGGALLPQIRRSMSSALYKIVKRFFYHKRMIFEFCYAVTLLTSCLCNVKRAEEHFFHTPRPHYMMMHWGVLWLALHKVCDKHSFNVSHAPEYGRGHKLCIKGHG